MRTREVSARIRALTCCAAFALCLCAAPAWAERIYLNPNAPHYKNARYGFSVALPPGQWDVMEADNGDGITAKGDESDPNSREIRAYGTMGYSVLGQDFAAALAEAEGEFATIERREADPAAGLFTLAGADKSGGLLYIRCFFGEEAANIVRIRCPDGWRAGFDTAVTYVEKSFKPGF